MKLRLTIPLLICILALLFTGCAAVSGPALPEGLAADIDLTAFSDTAAYAEVSRMQAYPEEYEGKTVMLRGTFRAFENPDADGYLFRCLVQDGTGCCTREMEFVLRGDHTYPQDYPRLNKQIVVIGTFATYTRTGGRFCTLTDAELYT